MFLISNGLYLILYRTHVIYYGEFYNYGFGGWNIDILSIDVNFDFLWV